MSYPNRPRPKHLGNSKQERRQECRNSPFQIAIHDREENLQEQVDGIDQYRQQVQPCLAGHHDVRLVARAYALSLLIFLSFCLSLRSCGAGSSFRAVLKSKLGAGKGFSEGWVLY